MAQQGSRSPFGHAGPPSIASGDNNRSWLVGMGIATVLTFVAQPVLAVAWAGAAIAAAVVLLTRDHGVGLRAAAVTALVLAVAGLLSTLVRLGALY
jgi:hypothetical protein